jgi:acyl carrier protein
VDSLLLLGLVTHLEKRFGFKVQPAEFTPVHFSSIDSMTKFITSRASGSR